MIDLTKPISGFTSAKAQAKHLEMSLSQFLYEIKESASVRDRIASLRAGSITKTSLPAIMPSGMCEPISREFIIGSHTGVLGYDIDHISFTEEIRDYIKGKPGWIGGYVTSSGEGVRAYLVIDPIPLTKQEHYEAYFQGAEYLKEILAEKFLGIDVKVDTQCQNPGRLNFISHDPGCWYNDETEPYQWNLKLALRNSNKGRPQAGGADCLYLLKFIGSGEKGNRHNQIVRVMAVCSRRGVPYDKVIPWLDEHSPAENRKKYSPDWYEDLKNEEGANKATLIFLAQNNPDFNFETFVAETQTIREENTAEEAKEVIKELLNQYDKSLILVKSEQDNTIYFCHPETAIWYQLPDQYRPSHRSVAQGLILRVLEQIIGKPINHRQATALIGQLWRLRDEGIKQVNYTDLNKSHKDYLYTTEGVFDLIDVYTYKAEEHFDWISGLLISNTNPLFPARPASGGHSSLARDFIEHYPTEVWEMVAFALIYPQRIVPQIAMSAGAGKGTLISVLEDVLPGLVGRINHSTFNSMSDFTPDNKEMILRRLCFIDEADKIDGNTIQKLEHRLLLWSNETLPVREMHKAQEWVNRISSVIMVGNDFVKVDYSNPGNKERLCWQLSSMINMPDELHKQIRNSKERYEAFNDILYFLYDLMVTERSADRTYNDLEASFSAESNRIYGERLESELSPEYIFCRDNLELGANLKIHTKSILEKIESEQDTNDPKPTAENVGKAMRTLYGINRSTFSISGRNAKGYKGIGLKQEDQKILDTAHNIANGLPVENV